MRRSNKIRFILVLFLVISSIISICLIKSHKKHISAKADIGQEQNIENEEKSLKDIKAEDEKPEEKATEMTPDDDKKQEEKINNDKKDNKKPKVNKNKDDKTNSNNLDIDKQVNTETKENKDNKDNKDKPSIPATQGNTVFLGDSITEGISFFDFAKESNVIAEKGFTVKKASKALDRVARANPDKIFIQLGVNDLLYGISSEEYQEAYILLVQKIKQKMPSAKIYVQAIFPVTYKIEQKRPMLANSRIDEFNDAIRDMAGKQGVTFLDVSPLFKDANNCMDEQYTSDGIHLKYNSYVKWFDFLEKSVGPLMLK